MGRIDIPRLFGEDMIRMGLRPNEHSRFFAMLTEPLKIAIIEGFRGQLFIRTTEKPRTRGDTSHAYVGVKATSQAIRTLVLADLLREGKTHKPGWGPAGTTELIPTNLCVAVVLKELDCSSISYPDDVIETVLAKYRERVLGAPADDLYRDTRCATVFADAGTWEYDFLKAYAKETNGDVKFFDAERKGPHHIVKAHAHAIIPSCVKHTMQTLRSVVHKHTQDAFNEGVHYGSNVLKQPAAGDIGVDLEGNNGKR